MTQHSPLLPFVQGDQRIARWDVVPANGADLPRVDGLLAGAAEVDITPPPGLPKAGHSRNARTGNGFRTRLRVRVIHLRSGTTSLALVACDLLGGSAVLTHLVAQAVADDTDVRLPGLFMGYTHTHAGPGQFHGCDFYNHFASNKPGFDPAWTQFLVERISGAIREAVATRKPARLATGSTEVWGFTRNRSLDAYVRNESVADKRVGTHRAYAAINPWLHLLRVDTAADDGSLAPLAALSVFSIHGTGISHHDRSYNADVWAYLNGELSHRIEGASGRRAVVGAMEGSHGDITPAVRPGRLVFGEAERVGRSIGAAAADVHERLGADLTDQVELGAGLREIDLDTDPTVDGVTLPEPAVGMAKLAGARENQTPLIRFIPPFRPGFPKPVARGPHGAKWIVGTQPIQSRVTAKIRFPRVLPIQVVRIGSLVVAGVPFETTAESGSRIEEAAHQSIGVGSGVDRVAVSSLVFDHWDYLTTDEEYTRQCYEGASNLHGPHTLRFVTAVVAELAADVVITGWVPDYLPRRQFALRTRRYLPRPECAPVTRAALGTPRFTEATVDSEAFWTLRWRDVAPGDLDWHEPLLRIETSTGGGPWVTAIRDGRAVDDQGWWTSITHLGKDRSGGHRYAARWFGPDVGDDRRHRFVLQANAGQPEFRSDPFD
ncbi:MAG: neutral/alkaline non-lysosomal ceramidase N-terminal domain-containing protein [Pseudonocardiaceae bacterium]